MIDIVSFMTTRWIIGVDFDDILHLNEKIGGLPTCIRRCTVFQNRINKCNLIDMGSFGFPFKRGSLTHRSMDIYEKLDRVFCNDRLRNMYPISCVKVIHRLGFPALDNYVSRTLQAEV